jgi:hypothetical protein
MTQLRSSRNPLAPITRFGFPSSKAEGDRCLKKEARSKDKLSLSQFLSLYCGKDMTQLRTSRNPLALITRFIFPSSKAEGDRRLKKEARSKDKLSLSQFLSLYCGKDMTQLRTSRNPLAPITRFIFPSSKAEGDRRLKK